MKGERHFAILKKDGSHEGSYESKTPSAAAKKVFSRMARGKKSGFSASFSLIEITQGSGGKVHEYHGKRVKLAEPKYFGKMDPKTGKFKGRVDKDGNPVFTEFADRVLSADGKGRGRKPVRKSPKRASKSKVKTPTASRRRSKSPKRKSPKRKSPKRKSASKKA